MDSLLNFVTHGAPLRALRARERSATKKIQLKVVRHQHHLQNYLYYRKNNIIPKGLVSKCRPTIFTNNPHFHERWRKNQLISGRKYLNLLIRECRKIIKTLEEQFAITKERLRKNSNVCFNYYNEKLSSMARSLEVLLYNRRLRKKISTRLNQADRTDLPTSFTPQLNTAHNINSNTLRSRRKHTKTRPTNKTNAPLDTSSAVNLSNVTLTDNDTQLLARGLGFCPSPRHIDWTEVNADFDEFARRLRITEFFHDYLTDNQSDPFHPKSLWTPPTDRDDALNALPQHC